MSLPPSYKSKTDGELVLLFQQDFPLREDDPFQEGALAFEELVSRYKRAIWSRAYRIMDGHYPDPAATADDLVSVTFFKAYLGLGALRSPDSFKNWLYTIATRACLDQLDDEQPQQKELSLEKLIEDGYSFPSEPDDADMKVLLIEFLKLLTPQERLVFVMRFAEGRTLDEIADVLGFIGTGRHVPVSRIVARCLHKLRKFLRNRRP